MSTADGTNNGMQLSPLILQPLVLLSLSDHYVALTSSSTPHDSTKSLCLGLLFGPEGQNSATDCLPFYPRRVSTDAMVVDGVAEGVAEAGSEGGVDERIQLNKQEEDDLKKRLIEYNELHKGVFPNDGEVVGIYYVSSGPSPTLPPSVASVFSICSSQFPSCLSVLVCDASSGGYTVLRQSTNLGGAAELKKAECEVAMTSVSRTVIESVVEGMEGEKGDENLREAVEELDDKLRLMEEYIESGGRDYETIRRIKGVVSSMNKNQSNIGGVVGTAENGVEALRFLAEVTRGTEKRRERTAHLF